MTRTQTPLSRWWKSTNSRVQLAISLALVGALLASAVYNVRAHSHTSNLERKALALSVKFNSIGNLKGQPYHSPTGPIWLMECDGDRLKLCLQYDDDGHTWADVIGVVQPGLKSGGVTLDTERKAIQESLNDVKATGILPEKCQVRVTRVHSFPLSHLWRVNWEVKRSDATLFSISTLMDGITGLPLHIHNCKY